MEKEVKHEKNATTEYFLDLPDSCSYRMSPVRNRGEIKRIAPTSRSADVSPQNRRRLNSGKLKFEIRGLKNS